ncbi:flagellar basal-body rod protein FlgG, partial [Halomonas sp.]
MITSLWTAKTGLESQQTKLDVISNNLANVSTNGFKRSRPVFEDLLYQNMRQPGAQNNIQDRLPSGMQVGTGVRAVATERLHTQGGLEQTENSRDLAINGEGFFQVLLPDGTSGYTRDGSFQLNENGQMVTANGYPLEPAIFVPENALAVTIAEDGTVSVRQPGVAVDNDIGQVTLTSFINPAGLESI